MTWELQNAPALENEGDGERLWMDPEGAGLMFKSSDTLAEGYAARSGQLLIEVNQLPLLFRFLADHLGYTLSE